MSSLRFLPSIAALTFLCVRALAQPLSFESEVHPGVTHRYIFDPAGPWKINILTIIPSRADLIVASTRAMNSYFGRETTSSMAQRSSDSVTTVIAALNADFFEKNGENFNNQIMHGEVIKGRPAMDCGDPKLRKNRSQFAITESGRPLIGRFVFDGRLFWSNGAVTRIGGINTIGTEDSLAVFTQRYRQPVPVIGDRSWFAASTFLGARKDTLICLVTETGISHDSIVVENADYIVVHGSATGHPLSSSGDTIRLLFRFPPATERLVELVGGFPQIVREQRNVVHEADALEGPLADSFAFKRHPRTGTGYTVTGDTLIWITVDGRQDSSAGMTLDEFADLMISHGVFQGLNLDGGGSTTMVVNGRVVNSPSDAQGERPVANCLLLVSRRQPPRLR